QLVRKGTVASRVDNVQTRADDGDAARSAGESPAMCRRIDAQREPARDGEPGVAESPGEGLRVDDALGRRVAAADNGEGWTVQQLKPPSGVEHGGRVGYLQQLTGIFGVGERNDAIPRLLEPGVRYCKRLSPCAPFDRSRNGLLHMTG